MVEASEQLVPVRVLSMAGLDLSVFRFDHDLTFAVLFMHPNGHIYHQYGNRDETGAQSHLSMKSLAAVIRTTVAEHADYDPAKQPPPVAKGTTVEDIPPMARRIAKDGPPGCIHCHSVNDMLYEDAVERGTWKPETAWAWPPARRVGIVLDRDDQSLITEVLPGSPAAAAGLRAGDRLTRLGDRPVATEGDVQWVLEDTPHKGGSVPVGYTRGEAAKPRTATLKLRKGWREAGPRELAYRNSVWKLSPKPGFGGKGLTAEEKRELGLPEDQFALRVGYLVTWGQHRKTGQNAKQAGIRKHDVVLSFDGVSDFDDQRHWHAWFRLTRKVGSKVELVVLRDGKRQTIRLPVIE